MHLGTGGFTVFSFKTFTVMSSSALMVYALSKGYSFLWGQPPESGIPLGRPGNIFSAGLILPLDICVGLVVAGTMYCFIPCSGKGGVIMQALVTNYYETAAMILFSIGFTMLLLQNLIKGHRAEHYGYVRVSVLGSQGYIAGGRAPIADGRTSVEGFINPFPAAWC